MSHNAARCRFLTIDETADELGVSRSTVERRIAAGEIPAIRLGESFKAPIRVDREELNR